VKTCPKCHLMTEGVGTVFCECHKVTIDKAEIAALREEFLASRQEALEFKNLLEVERLKAQLSAREEELAQARAEIKRWKQDCLDRDAYNGKLEALQFIHKHTEDELKAAREALEEIRERAYNLTVRCPASVSTHTVCGIHAIAVAALSAAAEPAKPCRLDWRPDCGFVVRESPSPDQPCQHDWTEQCSKCKAVRQRAEGGEECRHVWNSRPAKGGGFHLFCSICGMDSNGKFAEGKKRS